MPWSTLLKGLLVFLRYGPVVFAAFREIMTLVHSMESRSVMGPTEVGLVKRSTANALRMSPENRAELLTTIRRDLVQIDALTSA